MYKIIGRGRISIIAYSISIIRSQVTNLTLRITFKRMNLKSATAEKWQIKVAEIQCSSKILASSSLNLLQNYAENLNE